MLNQRPLRGISVNKNGLNTIQQSSTPSPPKFKALVNVGQSQDQPENKLADEQRHILQKQQSLLELLKPAPTAAAANQQPVVKPQPLQAHQQPKTLTTANSNNDFNKQQVVKQQNQNSQTNEPIVSRIPKLSLKLPPSSQNQSATNGLLNKSKPSLKLDLKINKKESDQTTLNVQQPKLTSLEPLAKIPQNTTDNNNKASQQVGSTSSKTTDVEFDVDEDKLDDDIEDIDKSETRDAIFLVCDIAKDIYSYMFTLEEEQAISLNYLKDQKIFTPKVRQRLVNWCMDIHSQLKLLPETLYITIALMDRYFEHVTIEEQSKVQLVAVSATLIASKYEEIYPPEVGDLVYLTRNDYSKRDILRTEIEILEQLNFDLGKPIPLAFLRRFSKAAHCDLKMHSIAKFLMELSLCEYECAHWKPSFLAATALFITVHIVRDNRSSNSGGLTFGVSSILQQINSAVQPSGMPIQDRWNKSLAHYTRYSRRQLQESAGILCKLLKKALKNPQSYYAVKKNRANLSGWPELKSTRVDDLIKSANQAQ